MRKLTISKLVELSLQRTKLILFKPFSWKKWLCLLFIAMMAGALGSGTISSSKKQLQPKTAEAVDYGYTTEQDQVKPQFYGYFKSENYPFYYQKFKSKIASLTIVGWIILMLLSLPLIIVLLWLRARFQFIWLESIIKNDASIAEPFKRHKNKGDSLFKFYLAVVGGILAALALIAMWVFIVGNLTGLFRPDAYFNLGGIIGCFILPTMALITILLPLMIIGIAVEQFVVVIMNQENCLISTAAKKFLAVYKTNQKEFWFYLLVLIVLSLVCGVIAMFAILICLVPLALAGSILIGIPYLLFKTGVIFIALAVIIGIPFLAVVIAVILSVSLPIAVFFKNFSLYFLSSLDCEYKPLEISS
ncbi:MAG: hypothetical protein KKH93_01710 [Candidatus Omnitrophica bacterium]|nr:hypothetical protein [Candidatus Omnitrophota bacterium]MBU2043683.1 hypothetical protein [Candidatus Omnitrophota bacterium]MBU2251604.1 hypothetical protein [Candidatus Omnitrophota bacterium]MBU2266219.1 hypothetical protein [Candidatus Omnitrophota bacterium]MBU2474171.1 hypothetical protein [Candidatus Omnitrophota bacterium]